LYPLYEEDRFIGYELKLPKFKKRVFMSHLSENIVLKEVQVKPFYDAFKLILVLEIKDTNSIVDLPNSAGIDFGVDNIISLVTNDNYALIYKGGAIKAENQYFNKEKARLTSVMTKGDKTKKRVTSKRLKALSKHRDLFITDQMHKISNDVVLKCLEHQIGILYLGSNKGWKQESNIGSSNNQNFAGIPFDTLKKMIKYKAERKGIKVINQEESYTSKADFLAGDYIPVYDGEKHDYKFSGKRIKRGLYKSSTGQLINADINGAANILIKADASSFNSINSFDYLFNPEIIGFKELNYRYSH